MENKEKKMNAVCPVCQAPDVVFFAVKNFCDIYKCQNCGLLFVWPKPDSMANVYSQDYFKGGEGGYGYVDYEADKLAMAAIWEVYLERMEKFLPNRGKLLDVGAATGVFLRAAKKRGWAVSGIEPVDWAAQKARVAGLEVKTGALSDFSDETGNYDAITYFDVFEHLADPSAELDLIYKILKPGGLLVVNTPDAGSLLARILGRRWHLLTPPEHLNIFNQNNLTRLLKKRGFEILEIKKIGKKFTLQYIFRTLANWQKMAVWRFLAEFLENKRPGKIGIPINLRDNFFVIARKLC